MYLYTVYDINKNIVFQFNYSYLNCFEIREYLLGQNIDYISCTRTKLRGWFFEISKTLFENWFW